MCKKISFRVGSYQKSWPQQLFGVFAGLPDPVELPDLAVLPDPVELPDLALLPDLICSVTRSTVAVLPDLLFQSYQI